MAKKPSSQPSKPNPQYQALSIDEMISLLEKKDTELFFCRREILRASNTISGLVKALNEKKTTIEVKSRPEIKIRLPKFYNSSTKEFEEPTREEIDQFSEDCMEILGFAPSLIVNKEEAVA